MPQTPAASSGQDGQWKAPRRERREKGPPPVKGEVQQVRWDPTHKFIHLNPRDGEPYVPFKELLKGKTGDERKKLLYEIAMDVKEYRRWRHARAVAAAAKKKSKEQQQQQQRSAAYSRRQQGATPEKRWKQKVMKKRQKQQEGGQQQKWQGRGRTGRR